MSYYGRFRMYEDECVVVWLYLGLVRLGSPYRLLSGFRLNFEIVRTLGLSTKNNEIPNHYTDRPRPEQGGARIPNEK